MNIADHLNAKEATGETLLQILQTTVAELSGDLPLDAMEAELKDAVEDEAEIDEARRILRDQPDLIRDIALLWIAASSQDTARREAVEGAIADADSEMPMLEVGALTLIALYAIYMFSPPKPTQLTWTIKQRPDGSFEKVEQKVSYAEFKEPIRGFLGLFSRGRSEG